MCFSTRGVFQSLLQCARCERATYLQLILFFSGVHGFIDAAVPVFLLQTLMHESSFFFELAFMRMRSICYVSRTTPSQCCISLACTSLFQGQRSVWKHIVGVLAWWYIKYLSMFMAKFPRGFLKPSWHLTRLVGPRAWLLSGHSWIQWRPFHIEALCLWVSFVFLMHKFPQNPLWHLQCQTHAHTSKIAVLLNSSSGGTGGTIQP